MELLIPYHQLKITMKMVRIHKKFRTKISFKRKFVIRKIFPMKINLKIKIIAEEDVDLEKLKIMQQMIIMFNTSDFL